MYVHWECTDCKRKFKTEVGIERHKCKGTRTDQLKNLVIDAYNLMARAKKFQVNDLQQGLYNDFSKEAVKLIKAKNRRSNK